ncbi:hypothetical protein PVL29_001793 [Vitis rotundifolia]|uniref:Uncharacterized protein n=1 Tax=Vitis rotundifolia TaxID=103349 RepID=A0AA39AFV8_VITRO|nr:hypothetical protein PVL29_001793 [Vitis rotundifolia]
MIVIDDDRVKPSPVPDGWKNSEICVTGIVIGTYLALMTVIFFWAAYETNLFAVQPLAQSNLMRKPYHLHAQLASAVYLQVSTINQALIYAELYPPQHVP